MRLFVTALFFVLVSLVQAQSKSPFDTLQVSYAQLDQLSIELDQRQADDIRVMNLNTKNYVIRVYAEEKPGTLIFEGRMKDIQRHRDYKLSKILSYDQFIAFRTKTMDASSTQLSENKE